MILRVQGVEVGSPNRSNLEAEDGMPLGIAFSLIFVGLGMQVWGNLGLRLKTNQSKKASKAKRIKRDAFVADSPKIKGHPL